MGPSCQIESPGMRAYLTCGHVESGGVQCERMDEHTEHWISDHTIAHSIAGNGWTCSVFAEPVPLGAHRRMLKERIAELAEELGALGNG